MLAALTFEFFRFRFHFRAAGVLHFPPFQAGNILRGAFGTFFRELACVPDCQGARTCDVRSSCPYALFFEPQAAPGTGPSGLADWPRPFVFRATDLNGRTIREGERFYFDLHIFDIRNPRLQYVLASFARLADQGLGPGRGRAELVCVDQLDLNGRITAAPCTIFLSEVNGPVERVHIRFATPTELKIGHGLAGRPEFGVLFARLRDRISTLRSLYGAGPLQIDFRDWVQRAAAVRITRCELQQIDQGRRSSRSGQRHPLGGFIGEAEYEGPVAAFLPYLRLGKWVGVGRQTVWGKGEMDVTELA
ncbi:MAG: CRISPR system precrRNA processing endoribonuclease RAMP protein Cas6 [Acidobacteriia bacterium]|nr:CRISPR system precrRNA processing endoribonuclease RAMP protein Cas6 [Terriglobia bacterium]